MATSSSANDGVAADATPATPQKPTVFDAVRTIDPLTDLQRLPNMPCARYSLLFGIVAGVSVGAMRFVFSRAGRRGSLRGGTENPWSEVAVAANWAVGAWGVGSLGAWETCRARQTSEAARMQALVSEIKLRRASRSETSATNRSPDAASRLDQQTQDPRARDPPPDRRSRRQDGTLAGFSDAASDGARTPDAEVQQQQNTTSWSDKRI
ncbi:hypothetical protein JCM3774_001635 [Rhodotorula dairenensis]